MELVRRVNSTYNQVNSNLKILQNEGIVFDEHFGRMRVIRLNKENPRTMLLLHALKILETSEELQPSKNRQPQLCKTGSASRKNGSEKERKSLQNDKVSSPKDADLGDICKFICFVSMLD
jgi:hypothetical protein